MWVRGLKLCLARYHLAVGFVAPRVGAWIETDAAGPSSEVKRVAPRVGAWIETRRRSRRGARHSSHPVWVRGLKQVPRHTGAHLLRVAPRVGAWIETYFLKDF